MTSPTLRNVACLMTLAGSAGLAAAQTVDLSYRWNEGASARYRTTVSVLQEAGRGSQTPDTEVVTTSVALHEVVGVREDSMFGVVGDIEITTEEVEFEADFGPAGTLEFDSTRRADRRRMSEPLIAASTYLLDETYTVTQQANGSFTATEGYTELLEDMLDEIDDRQMRRQLEASLEEFVYTSQMSGMWGVALGSQVSVGESWNVKRTRRDPSLGEIVMTIDYVLEDVETEDGRRIAVISAEGDVELVDFEMEGVQVEVVTSSIEADIEFDVTLGMLASIEAEQVMVLELRQGRQRERQTITTTNTIELLEFEDVLVDDEQEEEEAEEAEEVEVEPAAEPAAEPAPGTP
jgi:hypothetical protein